MLTRYYIGIMSGTSLDGVDVVLCEIDATQCRWGYAIEYPLPLELKGEILQTIAGETSVAKVGELDHRLGLLFSRAVKLLLKESGFDKEQICAIGLHGQTLWHQPKGDVGFTMQLGDPNILTTKTEICVVADFRRKDVALGGEGAPLAPAFHEFIFSNMSKKVSVLNVGGMANITILGEKLLGYDTGCGNVLLDMWIDKHKSLPYDKDGRWARNGKVDEMLLSCMKKEPYFALSYPKSTGREKFNTKWIEMMLLCRSQQSNAILKHEDVQRTLLELTAWSISEEIKKFHIEVLLLCGGGAKNGFLVERIDALLPHIDVQVATHSDDIESMTFAWLAYKRMKEETVNLKDVTGANKNAVLGGVYV